MISIKSMFILHNDEESGVGATTYGVDFSMDRMDNGADADLASYQEMIDFFTLADILLKFIRVRLHMWQEFLISGHDLKALYHTLQESQKTPLNIVRFTFSPKTNAVAMRPVTAEEVAQELDQEDEWPALVESGETFWPTPTTVTGAVISRKDVASEDPDPCELKTGRKKERDPKTLLHFNSDEEQHTFNPFMDVIQFGSSTEVRDACDVAALLLSPEGARSLDEEDEAARTWIVCAILHLYYKEGSLTLKSLLDFFRLFGTGNTASLWQQMDNESHPYISAQVGVILAEPEDVRDGVMAKIDKYLSSYLGAGQI